jgi:hypothetical protein
LVSALLDCYLLTRFAWPADCGRAGGAQSAYASLVRRGGGRLRGGGEWFAKGLAVTGGGVERRVARGQQRRADRDPCARHPSNRKTVVGFTRSLV